MFWRWNLVVLGLTRRSSEIWEFDLPRASQQQDLLPSMLALKNAPYR